LREEAEPTEEENNHIKIECDNRLDNLVFRDKGVEMSAAPKIETITSATSSSSSSAASAAAAISSSPTNETISGILIKAEDGYCFAKVIRRNVEGSVYSIVRLLQPNFSDPMLLTLLENRLFFAQASQMINVQMIEQSGGYRVIFDAPLYRHLVNYNFGDNFTVFCDRNFENSGLIELKYCDAEEKKNLPDRREETYSKNPREKYQERSEFDEVELSADNESIAIPSVNNRKLSIDQREKKESYKSNNSSHMKKAALKKQPTCADKAAAVWLKDRVKKTISLCRKHFVKGTDARGGCY
jgi:hypothetical protein